MSIVHTGSQRLLFRIIIYLVVIVVIYLVRGGIDWRQLRQRIPGYTAADTTLILAGSDLAPQLVTALAAHYARDYPHLQIQIERGGSSHALEAVINGRAQVAFLNRRPSPAEQQLFTSAQGDTILWYPIALGGIVLLQSDSTQLPALTLAELQRFVATGRHASLDHLYVADPNLGLWDAFCNALAGAAEGPAASPGAGPGVTSAAILQATADPPAHVVFLPDDESVLTAVRADLRGLGLISTLTAPAEIAGHGARGVPLQVAPDAPPVAATDMEVAAGSYPLYHYLYVACQADGSLQGSKFVTHVTSDRGQRQIARAGFVPSRLVLRQIYLTRHPVGQ
jgi:ABC-type phosphate transport system substrate-binding protein